jgi:rubredoxin
MVYTCSVCGYQYDEKSEQTPFDQLPDEWHCPICNAPKSAFQKTS